MQIYRAHKDTCSARCRKRKSRRWWVHDERALARQKAAAGELVHQVAAGDVAEDLKAAKRDKPGRRPSARAASGKCDGAGRGSGQIRGGKALGTVTIIATGKPKSRRRGKRDRH